MDLTYSTQRHQYLKTHIPLEHWRALSDAYSQPHALRLLRQTFQAIVEDLARSASAQRVHPNETVRRG